MLIYQNCERGYKEIDTVNYSVSSDQHFKKKATKQALKRKNIKFLTSLGFTVKKQNDK